MNKISLLKVFFFIVLGFVVHRAQASNKVTVAAIGGGVNIDELSATHNPQKVVDQMMAYWQKQIEKVVPVKPDIILLPETCDIPKGLNSEEQYEYFRFRKNQFVDFFSSLAKANNCYLAFGMKRESAGDWFNSCFMLDREGNLMGIYDENYADGHEIQTGIKVGHDIPLFECDFGKVACVICFDLNFDELRDRYAALGTDIILFPALYHGDLEQNKWAYSTRSFLISAIGQHTVPSEIRNPLGEIIATTTNYFNTVVKTINLDRKLVHLDYNWEKLEGLKKKYGRAVTITDPGLLGVVMIASEKEGVSILEMVDEFDIELADTYFERSSQRRLDALEQYNNQSKKR